MQCHTSFQSRGVYTGLLFHIRDTNRYVSSPHALLNIPILERYQLPWRDSNERKNKYHIGANEIYTGLIKAIKSEHNYAVQKDLKHIKKKKMRQKAPRETRAIHYSNGMKTG